MTIILDVKEEERDEHQQQQQGERCA